MDKTYVAMGHDLCPICGNKYNESVIIDKRLKGSFSFGDNCTLEVKPCDECKTHIDNGYIALIAVDVNKSPQGDKWKFNEPYRTGEIAWLLKEAWNKVFDTPCPPDHYMGFIPQNLFKQLEEMDGETKVQ